jgi:hypothetical protein
LKKVAVFAILAGIYSCFPSRKGLSKSNLNEFKAHLKLLDSASKYAANDTVYCCSSSIAFMVKNTDVPISANGTFHGFLFFTKLELQKWHKYYDSLSYRK